MKDFFKLLTNFILFGIIIGWMIWIWLAQLFESTYVWNSKNYDFFVIDNNDKPIEPIIIKEFITGTGEISAPIVSLSQKIQESNSWTLKDDSSFSEIQSINPDELKDIYKQYSINIPSEELNKPNINKGGYFVDKYLSSGIKDIDSEYFKFGDESISPIVQSIGKELPLTKIGYTYFNSDMLHLNDKQMAYTLYAHSNFGKGGNYIWEKVLKLNKWNTFYINNNKFMIQEIYSLNNNDKLDWILIDYIKLHSDILIYTCETTKTKRFIIAKKI